MASSFAEGVCCLVSRVYLCAVGPIVKADGKLVDMPGCGMREAAGAILLLIPLDSFVEEPVMRLQVVGSPDQQMPLVQLMQEAANQVAGRSIHIGT
jgi:L-fucose mutarotase/ribose pyranase (RbsD/FucU family)